MRFFGIPNTKKQTAKQQLTFIGKVVQNSDNQPPTKIINAWCNHKRRRRGVLHTNKKTVLHYLHLVIPGVEKNGVLNTWAHFTLDEKYYNHLIYVLGNYSSSTPPDPSPPLSPFQPSPPASTPSGKGKGNTINNPTAVGGIKPSTEIIQR